MPTTLAGWVSEIIGLINLALPVLGALATVLFMWGGVRYIYRQQGSTDLGKDKELLIWGLIALFVLFSVWGILNLMCSALLGSSCGTGAGTTTGEAPSVNGRPYDL